MDAVTVAHDGNIQMIDGTSVRVAATKKATRIDIWVETEVD